jgi:hypothetical protein
MGNFDIPSLGQVSTEPTDLTKAEMADLTASKRNTVLYERTIEHFKSHIAFLEGLVNTEKQEKQGALTRCKSLESEARNVAALRRAKAEMFVAFLLATISMTVGSALISSYPITNGQAPWQFSFGWALIVMAILMGVFGRAVVWLVVYKFPKYFHEAA